jgi:hypothetical protein
MYLLAWWLDLDVPLSPKIGASSRLHNLLQEKSRVGGQVRVMMWANWTKSLNAHNTPGVLGESLRGAY